MPGEPEREEGSPAVAKMDWVGAEISISKEPASLVRRHGRLPQLESAPASSRELKYIATAAAFSITTSAAAVIYAVLFYGSATAFVVSVASASLGALAVVLLVLGYFQRQEFLGAAEAVRLNLDALPSGFAFLPFLREDPETAGRVERQLVYAHRLRNGLLVSGDRSLAQSLDRAIAHIHYSGDED